jgi:hypothetical protein
LNSYRSLLRLSFVCLLLLRYSSLDSPNDLPIVVDVAIAHKTCYNNSVVDVNNNSINSLLDSKYKMKFSKYGSTLEGYNQSSAEQEVFNTLASAQRARQKLTAREVAQFGGTSGLAKTALSTGSGQI